jgi:hypothetical protein
MKSKKAKFEKLASDREILKKYMRNHKPNVNIEDLLSVTSTFRVTWEFFDLFVHRKTEKSTRKLPSMASTLLMMRKCGSFGGNAKVLRRIRTRWIKKERKDKFICKNHIQLNSQLNPQRPQILHGTLWIQYPPNIISLRELTKRITSWVLKISTPHTFFDYLCLHPTCRQEVQRMKNPQDFGTGNSLWV